MTSALGPLPGLPMTVKDALDVEGLPASAGVKSLLSRKAEDALVVRRVRSVDAIVWGKTNLPINSAYPSAVGRLFKIREV